MKAEHAEWDGEQKCVLIPLPSFFHFQSFEAIHTLQGHTDSVSCCSWSPDDSLLVTAGFDKTVKLWDIQVSMLTSEDTISGTITLILLFFIYFLIDGDTEEELSETPRFCHLSGLAS